jgi:hypothetical protein
MRRAGPRRAGGEVGQQFGALGGDDDLDAFKVASGGWVRHRVLSFSSVRSLSIIATTSSSVRAIALHPEMIGPS